MMWVFVADGPGQGVEQRIGGVTYRRGDSYAEVPAAVLAKGGFIRVADSPEYLPTTVSPVPALVIGQAPTWGEDVDGAVRLLRRAKCDYDVIAVNGAGVGYENPIKHWCTVHGPHFRSWIPRRSAAGADMHFTAWARFGKALIANPWESDGVRICDTDIVNAGGSSGLFAVRIAMRIGYTRVILCGIPLEGRTRVRYGGTVDAGEKFGDGLSVPMPGVPEGFAAYRPSWEHQASTLAPAVRSMSGWTRRKFGAPTVKWLTCESECEGR